MLFETLKYENDKNLAILTLSRENRLNAISRQMIAELENAFDIFESDQNSNVLIITGLGRAFSAGADIKERAENAEDISVQRTSILISPLFRRIET